MSIENLVLDYIEEEEKWLDKWEKHNWGNDEIKSNVSKISVGEAISLSLIDKLYVQGKRNAFEDIKFLIFQLKKESIK